MGRVRGVEEVFWRENSFKFFFFFWFGLMVSVGLFGIE